MRLGDPDETAVAGRAVPGSEFVLAADTAVKAIGQRPRTELAEWIEGLEFEHGALQVDPETGRTANPRSSPAATRSTAARASSRRCAGKARRARDRKGLPCGADRDPLARARRAGREDRRPGARPRAAAPRRERPGLPRVRPRAPRRPAAGVHAISDRPIRRHDGVTRSRPGRRDRAVARPRGGRHRGAARRTGSAGERRGGSGGAPGATSPRPGDAARAESGSTFANIVMLGAAAAVLGAPSLELVQDAAVETLGAKRDPEAVKAAVEAGYRWLS